MFVIKSADTFVHELKFNGIRYNTYCMYYLSFCIAWFDLRSVFRTLPFLFSLRFSFMSSHDGTRKAQTDLNKLGYTYANEAADRWRQIVRHAKWPMRLQSLLPFANRRVSCQTCSQTNCMDLLVWSQTVLWFGCDDVWMVSIKCDGFGDGRSPKRKFASYAYEPIAMEQNRQDNNYIAGFCRSDWHPIRLHIFSLENKSKYVSCRVVYARVQCFMVSFYMAKNCFICEFVIYMFAYTWHSHDWCRSGIEPFFCLLKTLRFLQNSPCWAINICTKVDLCGQSRKNRFSVAQIRSIGRKSDDSVLYTDFCCLLPLAGTATGSFCTHTPIVRPQRDRDWQPQIKSNCKCA